MIRAAWYVIAWRLLWWPLAVVSLLIFALSLCLMFGVRVARGVLDEYLIL